MNLFWMSDQHDLMIFDVPGSINSHYFHIIGDGKNQPKSVGPPIWPHYKDSVIKGGIIPIPNIATTLTMAAWYLWPVVVFRIGDIGCRDLLFV